MNGNADDVVYENERGVFCYDSNQKPVRYFKPRTGYESAKKGCPLPFECFKGTVRIGDREVTWAEYRVIIANQSPKKQPKEQKPELVDKL